MRVAAWLAVALAAAPAVAKGPPWTDGVLARPKHFGDVQLAAGYVALFSSGRAGHGTLASPLAVSTSLALPAGTDVVFGDEMSRSAPYWPMVATVSGSFSACGFEFGPARASDSPWLVSGVALPQGRTRISFDYFPAEDRRAHPDQVSFHGDLLHGISVVGLNLPAGSRIAVRCDRSGGTLLSWSGQFERDSEVGGALLRAGKPAAINFGEHGPILTQGELARSYELHARLLPSGSRLFGITGGMIATCSSGKYSALLGDKWEQTDCGEPLATPEPAPLATPKPVPAPRLRAHQAAWLGAELALLVGLASAARLRIARRAKE
jgi:hypothetical protein